MIFSGKNIFRIAAVVFLKNNSAVQCTVFYFVIDQITVCQFYQLACRFVDDLIIVIDRLKQLICVKQNFQTESRA